MRTKLTMNDLVRTAARYSRTAMTRTLRMGHLLDFGAGNADEDVVERGAGELEMADPAAIHEQGEDSLRIGPAIEPQLLPAAEVGHLGDARKLGQRVAPFDADPQRVVAVVVLNRFERAVEDLPAPEDHEDEFAHLLGDRHVVRRENHRR